MVDFVLLLILTDAGLNVKFLNLVIRELILLGPLSQSLLIVSELPGHTTFFCGVALWHNGQGVSFRRFFFRALVIVTLFQLFLRLALCLVCSFFFGSSFLCFLLLLCLFLSLFLDLCDLGLTDLVVFLLLVLPVFDVVQYLGNVDVGHIVVLSEAFGEVALAGAWFSAQ